MVLPLASTKANFVGRDGTSAPYLDMNVEFRNGGSLLDVAVTTSSFNVTGGTISNLTKVADGNYSFRLTPTPILLIGHADGAGTKSSLAYMYWKETGDLSVWKGIAQDALIMNIDDLICVGATDRITLSSTIGRNKNLIPGEVISAIINGTEELISDLKSQPEPRLRAPQGCVCAGQWRPRIHVR